MRQLESLELKSGLKVHLRVINPRLLTVQPVSAQHEILNEDGKLVGIDYNGEYLISQGTTIDIGKQKYKISEIRKDSTSTFQGYELFVFRKITTTANFILPLIGHDRSWWKWSDGFVNAFIGDEISSVGTHVKVLYRFSGTIEFAKLEDQLRDAHGYDGSRDPDKFHTIYDFKIPDRYREDADRIMKGKYSYISESAKARILDFHQSSRQKPIGQILYRCPKRKERMEADLGEGWNIPEGVDLLEGFDTQKEIYKEQFIIKEDDATKTNGSPPGGFI